MHPFHRNMSSINMIVCITISVIRMEPNTNIIFLFSIFSYSHANQVLYLACMLESEIKEVTIYYTTNFKLYTTQLQKNRRHFILTERDDVDLKTS